MSVARKNRFDLLIYLFSSFVLVFRGVTHIDYKHVSANSIRIEHNSVALEAQGLSGGLRPSVARLCRARLLLATLVAPSGPSPLGGDVVSATFGGLGSNQTRLRFMKGP